MRRTGRRIRAAYAALYVVALYLPVLFLPLFSVNDSVYVAFPLKSLTLRWYRAVLENEPLAAALSNSLIVASAASLMSTVLATLATKTMVGSLPGTRVAMLLLLTPLVLPGVILAVALLLLFNYLDVPLTLFTTCIGHIAICLPFAVSVLRSRFADFDVDFEDASADLGENPWFTFWRVTFPLILPAVGASLLLCFTISFDEFVVAFFLSSNRPTLPIFIWSQMRFPDRLPLVLALGSALLIGSVLMIVMAEALRRRGSGQTVLGMGS